jgi:hypothetical protein
MTSAQKKNRHDKLLDLAQDLDAAKENYEETARNIAKKHGRSEVMVP